MSIYFSWLHKFQNRNYPDHIRQELNVKYKSLHKHEKTIKNIIKHSKCTSLFGLKINYDIMSPKDLIRIKRHKYLIRKINREIDNIKNYYNGLYL